MPRRAIPTEHEEQAAVIQWARAHAGRWPCLSKLHASLNGVYLGGNGRAKFAIIAKQKAAGMLSGVPDLFLPYPSNGAHGLYIEMKRTQGGEVREGQSEFLEYADSVGYRAVICYGFEEARQALLDYLAERE